jgi:mRNA-degrading endonuclease toxin of MazEF toxin-antitoxin module
MLDKAHTIPIDKVGKTIGKLSKKDMLQINQGLALFFGLG